MKRRNGPLTARSTWTSRRTTTLASQLSTIPRTSPRFSPRQPPRTVITPTGCAPIFLTRPLMLAASRTTRTSVTHTTLSMALKLPSKEFTVSQLLSPLAVNTLSQKLPTSPTTLQLVSSGMLTSTSITRSTPTGRSALTSTSTARVWTPRETPTTLALTSSTTSEKASSGPRI